MMFPNKRLIVALRQRIERLEEDKAMTQALLATERAIADGFKRQRDSAYEVSEILATTLLAEHDTRRKLLFAYLYGGGAGVLKAIQDEGVDNEDEEVV